MNLIGTVLRHYIVDIGLNIMFDNIKRNMYVSKLINNGFVDDMEFPFNCEILVRDEIDRNDAYWMEDLICIGSNENSYLFKTLSGLSFSREFDDIIKIIVIENFGDDEGYEYDNENWKATYNDKDGNLRYVENDELVGD